MTPPDASNRVLFGAEQLQTTLDKAGYQVMMQQGDTTFSDPEIKTILLTEVNDTTLKKEGFHIFDDGQSDQSVRQGWEWCHLRMP